jgi:hypothetical protein
MANTNNTNDNIKTLLVIGGVLYLVSSAKNVFSNVRNPFSDAPQDTQLQPYIKDKYTTHVDLIKALNINQNNLQLDRNTYKRIAQQQYDAMNGPGTNTTILFNTVKNLNADELKTVFMDYGLRAPTVTVFGYTTAVGTREDLIAWYDNDLDKKELVQMADIWRKTGLMQ